MDLKHFVAPERLVEADFIVRGYLPGDGEPLVEALTASYDHLKTFMPWAKPDPSLAEMEQFARRARGNYLKSEDFVLGIFDAEEQRLLGGSGFHLRGDSLENRAAEIGMWIRAESAGQGLGTRVLRALVAWGFSDWPWERLAWRCDARNVASRRTAEKAGFELEGILRGERRQEDGSRVDTCCYAVLRAPHVDTDG